MHVPVAMCTTPSSMWLTMMEWIWNMDTLTQQMWEKLMQVMHFVLHFVQLLVCKISLCLGNESQLKWEIVMTLWNTCAYLYVPPFLTSQQYSCQYTSKYRGATARGIVSVSSGDEDSLLTAVATVGPIAVYIDASHTSFQVIVCTLQIHR